MAPSEDLLNENSPNQDAAKLSSPSTPIEKRTPPTALATLINSQMLISGKDALAEEFDVSITTIERWIREGVPFEPTQENENCQFHRGKVAKWRRENHGVDTA